MLITRRHDLLATLEGEQRLPAMACCKILPSGLQDQSQSHDVDWIITVMNNKEKAEKEKARLIKQYN